MTINRYFRQTFPYFDTLGNHTWCETEDFHIQVTILNDHAVIDVWSENPRNHVYATCDSTIEDDIVSWLDENLEDMVKELYRL